MNFQIGLTILLSFVLQQNAPPPKASITGTVTRAGGNEPLAGSRITLIKVAGDSAPSARPPQPPPPQAGQPQAFLPQLPPQIPAVTTDERGRFQVNNIDAGSYRIVAARNGYVRQEYGQKSLNGQGTILSVSAGQQIRDLALRLIPAPTISGRVIGANREPQPGITVQALRSTYDANGKRAFQVVQSARTNDLGEYRLYWLNPGRYFVSANGNLSALESLTSALSQAGPGANLGNAPPPSEIQSMFGTVSPANQVLESGYSLTYFPGTPDITNASSIELPAGSEMRVDFALSRSEKFYVKGRLIDAQTGRPPTAANVAVASRASEESIFESMMGATLGAFRGNNYNSSTGEFTVSDVAPGSYWLMVGAGPMGVPRAQMPLEVAGNIDNLPVTITDGITIPGRVRFEGAQPQATNSPRRISLGLLQPGASLASAILQGGQMASVGPEGAFSLNRVTPGTYKLVVNGLDPNMYVKDAHLDRGDALQGVTIGDRAEGGLDITISSNAGQATGTVVDATGKPVSGVQAILVPDRLRNRFDLYKSATTDANGRFSVRGLTPGDYKVFAWEDIEPYSYFDPEVLKTFETRGTPLRIQENSNDAIEVKIIQ